MPYKKNLLVIFQAVIVIFFTKILSASEPSDESPFGKLPGDFRRAMVIAVFERDDWLRFSETCRTYRNDFRITILEEVQKDRHAHQRYLNTKGLKSYTTFHDVLTAFQEGDPHVVTVIGQLFPNMSAMHLHKAYKAQSQRGDITPAEQARALYHLALLRILQRTAEDCLRLTQAYDILREVCSRESLLPDDLKFQGVYYMAKTQAVHEPIKRFSDWRPQYSWGEVFTILSTPVFCDRSLEIMERNFLIGALRIEGKVNHGFMKKEDAIRFLSQCWIDFSNIIGSGTHSFKKRVRVLRFKFDFLMRTRGAFPTFASNVPVMGQAWPEVLYEFRLLLNPQAHLPVKVREDLREKKLTLLTHSLENLISPWLVAQDLLEDYLEVGQPDRNNLSLEHRAETTMINMMDTLARRIYAQPKEVITLLRLFLVKYTPTHFVSEHVGIYAKTDVLESLLKAVEPFPLKRAYRNHASTSRILQLTDENISRREVCDLLVEPEILMVMDAIDSQGKWRDRQIRKRFCKWLQNNQEVESILQEDDTQRKRPRLAEVPHSSSDEAEDGDEDAVHTLFLRLSGSFPSMGTQPTQPLDDDY